MAPRKRNAPEPVATTTRVTRSSTRLTTRALPAGMAKAKMEQKKKKAKTEKVSPVAEAVENYSKAKTIVIEHCKQCTQFKIRAVKVKNGLEDGIPGINVVVNPEKPRRGCFEIREEGGEKFITLLNMARPFKPMKELDMDKVISDIIDKIK